MISAPKAHRQRSVTELVEIIGVAEDICARHQARLMANSRLPLLVRSLSDAHISPDEI